MDPKTQTKHFISHKELAEAYQVHRTTLKKELKRIAELNLRMMQRNYSPVEQQIIFSHLGNPFVT